MTKIERIAEPTGYSKKYTLFFAGGTRMRVEQAVIGQLMLYSGKELSDQDMEDLREAEASASSKARAVRMLAYSNLSETELRRKLKQKGESQEHTEETVEWLSDLNLINDEQAANQAVRSALAKGYGKYRVRQILYQKGIEKQLVDELLEDLPDPDDAIDRFLQKRWKGQSPDQKETKRTVDALMRRGHSWSDIKSAVARYTDALDDYLEEQE